MKFYSLVTVALDILIKEKNNTLHLPWISPWSFFYAEGVYSVNLSGELPYEPFSDHPGYSNPPPIIFYTNFQPPCLFEPPVYSGSSSTKKYISTVKSEIEERMLTNMEGAKTTKS